MIKIILCILLICSINVVIFAENDVIINRYTQLLNQGYYTTIIEELKPKIDLYEKDGIEFGLDMSSYVQARNLVADSLRMQKNFCEAIAWYGDTATMYLDPYATYCDRILQLSSIFIGFTPQPIYSQEHYDGWLGPHPLHEETLNLLLTKLLDSSTNKLKNEFFREMVLYDKNNDWVTKLVSFSAGDIKLDELLSVVPKESLVIAETYVGLVYEITGEQNKSQEMYQQALVHKESRNIELILAANRLGQFALKVFYEQPREPNYVLIELAKTIAVQASSSLVSYPVINLVDDVYNTAWVEGAKGNGVNEWIEFSLSKKKDLSYIKIINGYSKSYNTYLANNRVKTIRLSFDDGTWFDFELKDKVLDPQIILLPNIKEIKKMKLIILDIYKGTEYDDTCISEIMF